MSIFITEGPSAADPLDVAPITVIAPITALGLGGYPIRIVANTWRSRAAVWLLRRYVQRVLEASNVSRTF
jgi:hypothetical protein